MKTFLSVLAVTLCVSIAGANDGAIFILRAQDGKMAAITGIAAGQTGISSLPPDVVESIYVPGKNAYEKLRNLYNQGNPVTEYADVEGFCRGVWVSTTSQTSLVDTVLAGLFIETSGGGPVFDDRRFVAGIYLRLFGDSISRVQVQQVKTEMLRMGLKTSLYPQVFTTFSTEDGKNIYRFRKAQGFIVAEYSTEKTGVWAYAYFYKKLPVEKE